MIKAFRGEYRFLSNFWPAEVELDGVLYPSVEHAYQAAKTLDLEVRAKIAQADTAGKAKRLGKKAALREDWSEVRIPIMASLVWQKFKREPLRGQLIATGDRYIQEGNSWGDAFWGVLPSGIGENNMGKLLMAVRKRLVREDSHQGT